MSLEGGLMPAPLAAHATGATLVAAPSPPVGEGMKEFQHTEFQHTQMGEGASS
jgi:hypothetical protein